MRQRDPAERAALEQLRAGDIGRAVAWYRDNDRTMAAPEWADALDAAVDPGTPTADPGTTSPYSPGAAGTWRP